MKGAWGMAKDQLTGDSAEDNYDPKLSPLQAFTNSSKLTANQSVDHLEAFVESMATLGGMALGGLGGAVGAKFVGALGETGNKYGLRPASDSRAIDATVRFPRRLSHGRRPRFEDNRKVEPLLDGPVLRLLLRRAREGRVLGSLFYSHGSRPVC